MDMINKKKWNTFSEIEMEHYSVYNYYREKGFPYYPTNLKWRKNEFRKLKDYQKPILEGDKIRQTMHGLALAWSYHPYAFNIRCNDLQTPLEAFNGSLRDVIIKRIKMGDNMSDAGLRKMLRIFSGTQAVSNFRPTAAKAIYNEFSQEGVTWDMSAGFGGRLLGFETSKAGVYIGTDPSERAINGNQQMVTDFCKKPIELIKIGSEDFLPDKNSLDLAFTSPPYFDTEKYTNNKTQSYLKFPQYEDWLSGFLEKTLENAHYGLKSGAYLVINIADIRKYPLVDDIQRIATKMGFTYLKTLKLALSSLKLRQRTEVPFKYEPVFVYIKS